MTEQIRARNFLATTEIFGGIAIVIGLIVGFVPRQTGQFGGADCGSALAGGGDLLTNTGMAACGRALSVPATWTTILVIVGVLLMMTGMIVDAIQKSAWEQRRRTAGTS